MANNIKISVGAQNDCELVLDHPSVSRHHCNISFIKPGLFFIEDNKSKNGVFINGRRVNKSQFTENDKISLGSFELDLADIFLKLKLIFNKDRTDFSEEFVEIFQSMDDYEKKKSKILKQPIGPIIIRVVLAIIIIVILIAFPELIPNDGVRIGLIMSVGLVSVILNVFTGNKEKREKQLDLLKLDYEDLLVCPSVSML